MKMSSFGKINEDREIDVGKPVDFSFKQITNLATVGVEGPRATRIGRIPERGTEHRKYLTRSIWLNNNKLTNIQHVDTLVHAVLEQPEKLGWIDFSFNYITHLDDGLLKFPNLKIVYFHGNLIKDLDEIFKLRSLSRLRSVTFHGNPISEDLRYRMFVITYLPQVVNLDFSPVTNAEKCQPKPPEAVKKILVAEGRSD
ncbi:hypothetical protein ILUMI_24277 [Ignelater luminosus]|uniref:Leucine-rich repeat-containing protein 51 n=1 Tax=Ignelater luminosus TaxID=2038154 RepID=A0A8K0G0T7_IGNLU|nr:hypothetical protein ILUMI_24277 [Ignelater luminosus]